MNKIPSANNYHLHLRHKDHEDHHEYWLVVDGKVEILSVCPKNYPKDERIAMQPIGALRNFALLTSHVERWEVLDEEPEWHTFVDNIKVN